MVVSRTIFIISTITSLFTVAAGQNCKDYKFPDNKVFSSCTGLPVLDAYLHWNYDPFERTAEIAYRARQTPQGWISWGINPAGGGMIGTQALIAHQDTQGKMRVFSSQVTSYSPSLTAEPLNFPVSELSAEYSNNEMIIFTVLGPLEGGNSFNITWQAGNLVLDDIPQPHPITDSNLRSFGALDFLLP